MIVCVCVRVRMRMRVCTWSHDKKHPNKLPVEMYFTRSLLELANERPYRIKENRPNGRHQVHFNGNSRWNGSI